VLSWPQPSFFLMKLNMQPLYVGASF
jgi:hypothetical protein